MKDQYLERLGVERRAPSLEFLSELQASHLIHVPFENLDVFHRRGVSTEAEVSVEKVIGGRGGWCFELNGAFGWLLNEIGFDAEYVSCRVLDDDEWSTLLDAHFGLDDAVTL